MKTYNDFLKDSIEILELYYRPNEKLPSGKTPVQKARSKGIRGEKLAKVRRGADNRNFDTSKHRELKVEGDKDNARITHKKSGITYTVRKSGKTRRGKDQYNLVWTHNKKGNISDREAYKVGRDSDRVFRKHVADRLPHGSVAHNNPLPNYKIKGADDVVTNPRAKIYKRWGFGDPQGNPDMPDQYAKVGRSPSSKQRAKGKTRLSPINDPDD